MVTKHQRRKRPLASIIVEPRTNLGVTVVRETSNGERFAQMDGSACFPMSAAGYNVDVTVVMWHRVTKMKDV